MARNTIGKVERNVMNVKRAILLIVFVCCFLVGLSSSVIAQDNKARIEVGKIEAKDCSQGQADEIGEMLAETLENSGKYILGATADFTVEGKVKSFKPEVKEGGAFGALKKKALGSAGAKSKTAEIEIEFKVKNASAGKEIDKFKVKGKSSDWSLNATNAAWSSGIGLKGSLKDFSGEPMEDAIKELLAKTAGKINDAIPSDFFKYSGDEQVAQAQEAGGPSASTGSSKETASGSAGAAAEDMTLYKKYDFVPGDKVIFYDDMKGEEEAEFPLRWNLKRGVFEVVRLGKEYWIMCTDNGTIRPKLADAPLPDKYTVELDFYVNKDKKNVGSITIIWLDSKGKNIGEYQFGGGTGTSLTLLGHRYADQYLPEYLNKGVHTMRIMATSRSMKCFLNEIRTANVPKVEGFNPVGFEVYISPYNDPTNPSLIRGFRFAEGGKSMREQLDETGKIVTHGILFDSGSHTIKGTSYKTLKNIGTLLTDDPELRLSIEGHTDSDGADDYNMSLSERRAASVRDYLIAQYGIAADRLESKGWGETKPLDTNDSAEGKANNRRVELVKL